MDARPVRNVVRRPVSCIFVILFGHGCWADAGATAYNCMSEGDAAARSRKKCSHVRAILELQMMMARDRFREGDQHLQRQFTESLRDAGASVCSDIRPTTYRAEVAPEMIVNLLRGALASVAGSREALLRHATALVLRRPACVFVGPP